MMIEHRRHWLKEEREALLRYADEIAPKNWNIYTDELGGPREEKGVLNIYLDKGIETTRRSRRALMG